MLVGAIFVFLAISYEPARTLFNSTADVAHYQAYAGQYLAADRQLPREYPPLSVLIFLLPQAISSQHYGLAFAIVAAAATALVVLMVDNVSGRGGWLIVYLLLGAFGTVFFRYDIFVVALTVGGFVAAQQRRWLMAQALLGVAVALKLYPVVLMPLVVIAQWRVERRYPWRSAIGGAIALNAAVATMALLAPDEGAGMLRYHRERPLEFESVGASIAWLFGARAAEFSFGSWNLRSPGEATIIALMTVLSVSLLLALYALVWRGRLSPARAWALALIIMLTTSKVFSAQYLIWVLPFIAILEGPTPAHRGAPESLSERPGYRWLWLIICLATGLIYPVALELFHAPDWMMPLVALRNVLLIAAGMMLLGLRSAATSVQVT